MSEREDSLVIRMARNEFDNFRRDYPNEPEDRQFEIFTAHCALKRYEFDHDALENGIVGQGKDGGIDWVYVILNGRVLSSLDDLEFIKSPKNSEIPRGSELEILIGQAKKSPSFRADVGNKLLSTFVDLFAPDSRETHLPEVNNNRGTEREYAENLILKVRQLKEFWNFAVTKRPKVNIKIIYSSLADKEPHKDVIGAFKIAERQIEPYFQSSNATSIFLGASKLHDIANERPSYNSDLKYQYELDSSTSKVALVNLVDYFNFLVDENGVLKQHFFEDNVRDFEGKVEVNKSIAETLRSQEDSPDFWWLNNGITILVSDTPISRSKTYSLENVQIVNGLQTSHSIFNFFNENPEAKKNEKRSVLLRILTVDDDAEKDKIIRATNSQTSVSVASLRSTNEIHRQIESALKLKNLYYDRRKNYWKHQGKSPRKIISITALSQAVISAFLQRPDTARARPTSFLKADETYKEIFENRDLEDFVWAALALKNIEDNLSIAIPRDQNLRNNLKFYVLQATRIYGHCIGTKHISWDISACPNSWQPSKEEIQELFSWVLSEATHYAESHGQSIDQVCKGSKFKEHLEDRWLKGKGSELTKLEPYDETADNS